MLKDKANIICLLNILKEYSDEKHILSMKEIIKKMKSIYDIDIDRRTIYGAVEVLNCLGYDISPYSENKQGYYIRERELEQSELQMLTDAVCSFPFISEEYTKRLIKKLQSLNSIYNRKLCQHLSVIRENLKTDNAQIFLNIELLDEAIENKKQISFTYLTYNNKMELVARREQPYVVNPYNMIYTNEHYYLVCNLTEHSETSLYRIDRIKDIQILDSAVYLVNSNPSEAANNAIYAFTGKPETVIFAFDKSQLNNVIDRFGTEIFLSEQDNRYMARVNISPVGMKFWALQYLPYVEVIEPKWLRNEIVDIIKNNNYL
jgi:predicted DNA-binding transcriptional regulator YafY